MSDTLLRYWNMLRLIPRSPRRIDATSLRSKLSDAGYEIGLRTIQRDLVTLSASFPLLSDESKPQGWSWRSDAPLVELPTLEPQTALVFHLVHHHLINLLPTTTLDYLAPWFKMADSVLDQHGNGLSAWRSKVRVLPPGQPLCPPQLDSAVQAVLTQALLQEKRVSVRYLARNASAPREYVVNPLGLVVRDQSMYFVCTLWNYENIKQLVLHRIESATLLEEAARQIQGFDLDTYIAQGELSQPVETGKVITLVLHFSTEVAIFVRERPLAPDQCLEQLDEDVLRLTANVPDTLELRWWLQSFGADVEVIGPASLRQELKAQYQRLVKRYEDA